MYRFSHLLILSLIFQLVFISSCDNSEHLEQVIPEESAITYDNSSDNTSERQQKELNSTNHQSIDKTIISNDVNDNINRPELNIETSLPQTLTSTPPLQLWYKLNESTPAATQSCQDPPSMLVTANDCGYVKLLMSDGIYITPGSSGISLTTNASTFDYTLSSVTAYVKITHPNIGDLLVKLISPAGTEHVLHNHSGGSTDNLDIEINLATFNSEDAVGTWTLKVYDDQNSSYTGHVTYWGVKLNSSGLRKIINYDFYNNPKKNRTGAYNGSWFEDQTFDGIGFNGSSFYLQSNYYEALPDDFSISTNIYPSTISGTQTIFHIRSENNNMSPSININLEDSKIRVYLNNDPNDYVESSYNFTQNNWTTVTVSFKKTGPSSTNVKIFINLNPLEDSSGNISHIFTGSTYMMLFGVQYNYQYPPSNWFYGRLDEIKIYSGTSNTYDCNTNIKPSNSSWNTVSSYDQTWNGFSWVPNDSLTDYDTTASTTSCRYKCDPNYISWKDPASWITRSSSTGSSVSYDYDKNALKIVGYRQITLNKYFPIDTSKDYYIEYDIMRENGTTKKLYTGTRSYDQELNLLPGHPGSYDYFGDRGTYSFSNNVWYTGRKNVHIGGSPRTGESSDQTVIDKWHTGTKYARVNLFANYYGDNSEITYIRNLTFYTTNGINTGGVDCTPATQIFNCAAKPANTEWNSVSKYVQTWDGTSWTPSDSTTSYNTTASTSTCRYKCAYGYTWDGANCINSKIFNCTAKPEPGTVWNSVSSLSQSWSGTEWIPADDSVTEYNATASTTECRYKCDTANSYVYDPTLTGANKCRKCGDGIVEGSEICDGSNLNGQSCSTQVSEATGGTITCNSTCSGFITNGCLKENQSCTGLPTFNASWNTVSTITQTWDDNNSEWVPSTAGIYNEEPSTSECRYKCNLNYHLSEDQWGNPFCSADSREYTCPAKPTNSVWNTVSNYTQTWDGSNWMPLDTVTEYNETPSTEACRYKCDDFYRYNGAGECIDIDECWEGTYDCPDHSVCVNDDGPEITSEGYHCDCLSGYTKNTTTGVCEPNCGDNTWVEGEECDQSVILTTSCKNLDSSYKDTPATCSNCTWDTSSCEDVCDGSICGITWATTVGGTDITVECSSDGTCGSSSITCSSTGSLPEVSCGCPAGYHLELFPALGKNYRICASDTRIAECPTTDMPENAEFSSEVINGAVTLTWDEENQNYGVLQPDSSFLTFEEVCEWSCATGYVEDQSQGLHFTHADFGLSWSDTYERTLYGGMEQIFSRLNNMSGQTSNVKDAIYSRLDSDIKDRLSTAPVSCDDNDETDAACADMTYRVMASLTSITVSNTPLITYDGSSFSAVDATTVLTEETQELIQNLPETILALPGKINLEVALVNRRIIEDALNYVALPQSITVRRGYNAGEQMCVNRRIENCIQDHIGVFDFIADQTTKTIMPESYYYIYSENLISQVVSTYENGEWNVPQCPWTCKPGTQESTGATTHCEPTDLLTIPDSNLRICANRSIKEMKGNQQKKFAEWLKEICADDETALDGVYNGICTTVNAIYDLESLINDLLPGGWQLVIWTEPEENDPVYFADAQLVEDMDCSYSTLNDGDMSGTEDKTTYIRNLESIQYFISLKNLNLEWQAVRNLDPLGRIPSTGYLQEPMQLIFGEDDSSTPTYLDNDLEQIANGAEITVRKFEIVPNINSNTCPTGYRKITDSIIEQHLYNGSSGNWYKIINPTSSATPLPYINLTGDNACLNETYLTDGSYLNNTLRIQNCSGGSGRGIIVETLIGTSQRAIMMCENESDATLPYARVRAALESTTNSSLWPLRKVMIAEIGLTREGNMFDKTLGDFRFDTEPSYSEGDPTIQFRAPKYSIELTSDNEKCGTEEKAFTLKVEGDVYDMFEGAQLTDLDATTTEIPTVENNIVICADASTGEIPNVLFQQYNYTTYALKFATPKIKGLETLSLSHNTHTHPTWSTELPDISPLTFLPNLEYLSLEGTPSRVATQEIRDLSPLVHNHSMKWLNLSNNVLQSSSGEDSDPYTVTGDTCIPETEQYFNETPQCFSRTGELRALRNMTELKTFIAKDSDISYFNQRLNTAHRQCSCGDVKNYRLPKDIVISEAVKTPDTEKVPPARYTFIKDSTYEHVEAVFEVPYPTLSPNCTCNPCKLIEDQVRKLWEDYNCDIYTNCEFEVDNTNLDSHYVNSTTGVLQNTCKIADDTNGNFSALELTGINNVCSADKCELTRHTRLFRKLNVDDAVYSFDFNPEYDPQSHGDMNLTYKVEVKYDPELFNEMMRIGDTNSINVFVTYNFNGILIYDIVTFNTEMPSGGITDELKFETITKTFSQSDVNTIQKSLEIAIPLVRSYGVLGANYEYETPMFIKSITLKNVEIEYGGGTQCEENIVDTGDDAVETCECNIYTGKCDGKKWYPGSLAEQWSGLEYLDLSGNTLKNDTFLVQHADSRMGNIETTCEGADHIVFVGKYDGISYFKELRGLFLNGVNDLEGLSDYNTNKNAENRCDVSQDRLAGLIPLLPELKYVDIGGTLTQDAATGTLAEVPDFSNAKLKELDMSDLIIETYSDVKDSINNQYDLEYLDLSTIRMPNPNYPTDPDEYRSLVTVDFIKNMQNLQYLNLSDNAIYPNNFDYLKIGHFPRLEYLDVSKNHMFKLGWLDAVPALKYLNISENNIQEIEQIPFLSDLVKLDITEHCIVDANGYANTTRINDYVDSEIELIGASTIGTGCTAQNVTETCGNGIREGIETCDTESVLCRTITGQEGKAGYAYCNSACNGWITDDCETTDEDFPDEDPDEEIPDIDTDLNCNHGVIMIASNGEPFCLCDDGYHMEGDHCVPDSVNGMSSGSAEEIKEEAGSLSDDENDIQHMGNLKEETSDEDPDEVSDDDTETIEDVSLIYNCSYPTVENCFSESYQRDDCGILYRGVCKDMMNFCMPINGQCCIPEKDDAGNLLDYCKAGSQNICREEVISGVRMCSRKEENNYLGCHFLGGDGACGAQISSCVKDITDIQCHTNADCGCGKGDDQCLYQCEDVFISGFDDRRCVGVTCDNADSNDNSTMIFDENQCAVVQDHATSPTIQICLAKDLAEQIHLVGDDENSCHGYPEIVSLEFDENNNLVETVSCQLPSPMLKFSNECDHSFVGCLNNLQARIHNLFRFNTDKLPIAGDSNSSLRCGRLETVSDQAFCGAFSKNGNGSKSLFEDETSTGVESSCNLIEALSEIYGIDAIDCSPLIQE